MSGLLALRPLKACGTEQGYLRAARFWTVLTGAAGTGIGLIFVDPDIQSLFDTFIQVIGLFMGVLGGLFVLGALTRRAHATGAMLGTIAGTATMAWLWRFTDVNGYLYTTVGITTCLAVGYVASCLLPGPSRGLAGLTLHTLHDPITPTPQPFADGSSDG